MRTSPPKHVVRVSTELIHVVAVLTIGVGTAYHAVMLRNVLKTQHLGDFGRMYHSARVFLGGGSLYGPSPVEFSGPVGAPIHNLNPPHAQILFLPVAVLPEWAAFLAGLVTAAACSLLMWRTVASTLNIAYSAVSILRVGAVLLAWSAVQAIVGLGQLFALFLVWPAASAWRCLRTKDWTKAGAWLGLLVCIKPFLAPVLVVFLPSGRRQGLVYAAGSAGLAMVAGWAVFGWQAYVDWTEQLSGISWPGLQENASLLGGLTRMFDPSAVYYPGLTGSGGESLVRSFATVYAIPAAVPVLHIVLCLFVGATSLVAVFLSQGRKDEADRCWMVLIFGSLLMSPLGWTYYLPLALPAAAALWRGAKPAPRRAAVVLAAGMFWPISLVDLGQPHALATLAVDSIYMWSLLGLWCLVCCDTIGRAKETSPQSSTNAWQAAPVR